MRYVCVYVLNGYDGIREGEKNGKNVSIRVSGQQVQLVSLVQARSAPAGKYLVPGASHKRAMKGGMSLCPEIYGVQFRFRGPKG